MEGGDEVRADRGAGNIHPGSKVTSRDSLLQAQGSWCRKERLGLGGALNFRVLMPLVPSSVGNCLNQDILRVRKR